MHAAPDETAVRVDVDLGDAHLAGLGDVLLGHALGAGQLAARGVDALHLVLRHRAGPVHDHREAGQELGDLRDDFEMQTLGAGELVGAVARADRAGQRIAARALDEFDRLLRIGQLGVRLGDRDVLFDAAELAELGLDRDALGVGRVDDALRDGDVLVEGLRRGVDHHRAVEAARDAVHAGLLVAVVQMNREDRLREDLVRRADHRLQQALVRVGAGALGDLDDEGGLAVDAAAEEPHDLLGVVDVVGADRVLAVRMFKKHFSRNDHVATLS